MSAEDSEKLKELIADFDTAMLVTHSPDGALRARPMALAEVTAEGDLWFVSDRRSGKMEDIEADAQVNVTMQDGGNAGKFVSLSGRAREVEDRRKVAEVWNEPMRIWFPGGKDDPNLVLLRVDAEEGEFWDNSGLNAIKYLIKAGNAYLHGERPANDRSEHGKAKLGFGP
jgi:general stress protein 26